MVKIKKFLNSPLGIGILGSLIASGLIAIGIYVYQQLQIAKIGALVLSFFTLKFPIWIYFTVTITIYFINNLIANLTFDRWWKKNGAPVVESARRTGARLEQQNTEVEQYLKEIKHQPQIFLSNNSLSDSYQTYGQKRYNPQSQQLVGLTATGSFHLKDNILTVERTNVDGRFIINICKNYYGNEMTDHVTRNLYGRNPRCIKFKVFLRCSGGTHTIFFIIKKYGAHDWINNVSFEISSAEWQQQIASYNIPINEDFQIQMEIFNTSPKPEVFQIKDLIVEEV